MLVWLLNLIFNIAYWALGIASWVLLIYVVMSWIIPTNKYTLLAGRYVEPLLAPIRSWVRKVIPALGNLGLDVSPVVLWLLINVAQWLLRLLQGILL